MVFFRYSSLKISAITTAIPEIFASISEKILISMPYKIFQNKVYLSDKDITIFPNPTNSEISYNIEETFSGSATLTIVDAFGKIVYEQENEQLIGGTLNVKNLPSGIYFLKVAVANQFFTQKFIKQ